MMFIAAIFSIRVIVFFWFGWGAILVSGRGTLSGSYGEKYSPLIVTSGKPVP